MSPSTHGPRVRVGAPLSMHFGRVQSSAERRGASPAIEQESRITSKLAVPTCGPRSACERLLAASRNPHCRDAAISRSGDAAGGNEKRNPNSGHIGSSALAKIARPRRRAPPRRTSGAPCALGPRLYSPCPVLSRRYTTKHAVGGGETGACGLARFDQRRVHSRNTERSFFCRSLEISAPVRWASLSGRR